MIYGGFSYGGVDKVKIDVNKTEDVTDMELAWAREANPIVQETIRVAIQRLSRSGRAGVTKKHILKVLFLARENLPDNNHIKHNLAYYWYKEGPYSEVVYANLDQMIDSGLVKVHKTDKSETYKLVSELTMRPVASGADLDAARREIGLVASENPKVHDAVRHTYEMAPFKWYTTYNLEFKPQFEAYCKNVLTSREGVHTDNDMLERLDDSVLDYPTIPEFMEHRMMFMDFAKMANAFLRRDSHHTSKNIVEWLPVLSADIWDAFAYGVRVHHHDPQYDSHLGKWREMYDTVLDKLEYETNKCMEQFGDVSVNEPDLDPGIEDMILHPENHVFTPLSLDVVKDR